MSLTLHKLSHSLIMIPLKIYGLIGYPVKHSLSPKMHNAAFKNLKEQGKIDYDAEYRLFEVPPERLEEFLLDPNAKFEDIEGNSLPAGDVLGFNITIPHKVKAREILEREFPFNKNAGIMERDLHYVKVSGAVNTVKRVGKELEYLNTDAEGFLSSLKEDFTFDTKIENVLIIGSGGAGRAVTAALSWKSLEIDNLFIKNIFIYDVNKEAMNSAKNQFKSFQYVMDKIEFISTDKIPKIIKDCQLLVNASPVGMSEDDGSVIDKDSLHSGLFVYDVVYNRETQLIKDAKTKEPRVRNVCGGRGMLLHQGAAAFEFWTGQEAPIEIMRKALEEELARCKT